MYNEVDNAKGACNRLNENGRKLRFCCHNACFDLFRCWRPILFENDTEVLKIPLETQEVGKKFIAIVFWVISVLQLELHMLLLPKPASR